MENVNLDDLRILSSLNDLKNPFQFAGPKYYKKDKKGNKLKQKQGKTRIFCNFSSQLQLVIFHYCQPRLFSQLLYQLRIRSRSFSLKTKFFLNPVQATEHPKFKTIPPRSSTRVGDAPTGAYKISNKNQFNLSSVKPSLNVSQFCKRFQLRKLTSQQSISVILEYLLLKLVCKELKLLTNCSFFLEKIQEVVTTPVKAPPMHTAWNRPSSPSTVLDFKDLLMLTSSSHTFQRGMAHILNILQDEVKKINPYVRMHIGN